MAGPARTSHKYRAARTQAECGENKKGPRRRRSPEPLRYSTRCLETALAVEALLAAARLLAALLVALPGILRLLTRLLTAAALLLTRLTRLRVVLLLLVAVGILIVLRHGYSNRIGP